MKNFRIYDDGEAPVESRNVHRLYKAGTHLLFDLIDGRIVSRLQIPVQFA